MQTSLLYAIWLPGFFEKTAARIWQGVEPGPESEENLAKALDEYRTSQEYVADFPTGRYNLGNYYAKMRDLPRAEENYREAIRIDDLFYPAKANLVLIYYQQGRTDSVIKLCRNMIASNPDLSDGYYYLALLYGEQKKYPEAIALLETASVKARTWDCEASMIVKPFVSNPGG